jgi:FkbH-like protein
MSVERLPDDPGPPPSCDVVVLDRLDEAAGTDWERLVRDCAGAARAVFVEDDAPAAACAPFSNVRAYDRTAAVAAANAYACGVERPFTTADGAPADGEIAALLRLAACAAVRPAKLVALDADGTLWGGILAETGVRGLAVGNEARPDVFFEIQRRLAYLAARGTLLALVSKNDESAVRRAFRERAMPLEWDDFAFTAVSWEPKSFAVRAILAESGFDEEDVWFADDDAYELDEVRHAFARLGFIACAEPARLLAQLQASPWFEKLTVTDDDLLRHAAMRSARLRSVAGIADGASLRAFLEAMEFVAETRYAAGEDVARVAQLLERTTQFNLTAATYPAAELERLARRDGGAVIVLRLRDKYGDNGIVAAAVLFERGGEVTVDALVMSCRVIGRGVESALWRAVVAHARAAGARTIAARYAPTARNAIVALLYEHFGMRRTADANGAAHYAADVPPAASCADWIEYRGL